MNFKFVTILVFIGLFSAVLPKVAEAFSIDLEKLKPLSAVEFIPQEEFEAQTQLIEQTPLEDSFLSFQVRLPKSWAENKAIMRKDLNVEHRLGQRVLGEVTRYVSPPKNYVRSAFSVEALELEHEISARHWFVNYVVSNGLTIEQVGTETDKAVEALYVEVEGDMTYIVRVKAIINGPRIVVAKHFLPQEHYDAERVEQAQIINSFNLLNREEVGVEELKIHGFLTESFFDYPTSWNLWAGKVSSMNRMKARLSYNQIEDTLGGQMKIFLSRKLPETTRSGELKHYRPQLGLETHEMAGFIENPDMTYHKDMSFGVTQAYVMKSKNGKMLDYELWVSVIEGDDYIYVLSLLTPARTNEFYTWARNVEAYRLVVKGLRRHDENVDYYRFIR